MGNYWCDVKCPYCGHINLVEDRDSTQLIYCDVDKGGCAVEFAVRTEVLVTATAYKLEEAA